MDSCNCGRRPIGMPYAGRITPANQPAMSGSCRSNMSCANTTVPPAVVTPSSQCGNDIHCHGPIAMAYVPWQTWKETYPLDRALVRGTIFPELDQPFVMGRCR